MTIPGQKHKTSETVCEPRSVLETVPVIFYRLCIFIYITADAWVSDLPQWPHKDGRTELNFRNPIFGEKWAEPVLEGDDVFASVTYI